MSEKQSSNDQADANRRAYDAIFGNRMFMTRLAYRVPFFLIELLVFSAITLFAPICAGWLLVAAIRIVQEVYPRLLQLTGYWIMGLVAIGGASLATFVLFACWSALKDSAVRLWKLIRKKD